MILKLTYVNLSLSADLQCFLVAHFQRMKTATKVAKIKTIWREKLYANTMCWAGPATPAQTPMAGSKMQLKNFVKSLAGVFKNFDVYVSLSTELLSRTTGATDYKYKNRLTGGFIGKNLATNRKYTKVTLVVYFSLKTELKSEDQSFKRRCSDLRGKFCQIAKCRLCPNFGHFLLIKIRAVFFRTFHKK